MRVHCLLEDHVGHVTVFQQKKNVVDILPKAYEGIVTAKNGTFYG